MNTMILRFRDLSIPGGQTIQRHRDRIESTGYVWWGWIMRQRETFPVGWLSQLQRSLEEKSPQIIYLFHSGECALYEAELLGLNAYPGGGAILAPEVHKTPNYMSEAECPVWFKLGSIGPSPREVTTLSIVEFPTLDNLVEVDQKLLKVPLKTVEQLRFSTATLWHVNIEIQA